MADNNSESTNVDNNSDSTHVAEPSSQDFADTGFRPMRSNQQDRRISGEELLNLPHRTLSANADLEEYTSETAQGHRLKEVKSNHTGKIERYELVTWKIDDPENPKNWSKAYKWVSRPSNSKLLNP